MNILVSRPGYQIGFTLPGMQPNLTIGSRWVDVTTYPVSIIVIIQLFSFFASKISSNILQVLETLP